MSININENATDGRPIMYYTYILESEKFPNNRYIGYTSDLKQRLIDHNSGKCRHTSKLRPWKLILYIAFEDSEHARDFERYLKSGSGHAFANKHFWKQSHLSEAQNSTVLFIPQIYLL